MTSRPLGRIIRPNGRDEGGRYYACRNFRWLSNDNSNSGSRLIEKATNVMENSDMMDGWRILDEQENAS